MTSAELAFSPAAKWGRWWFQYRSVSPVPLFLLLVLLPPDFQPDATSISFSVLAILVAEAARIWAVGYAGSATRTRGDTVPSLVTAGPFGFVRNPLYLANTLMYTACGFLFGFYYLSVFIAVYSSIQYVFIVAYEETILAHNFGAAFEAYCQKVPRWVPAFTRQIEASFHPFQLGPALKSEKSTLLAMVCMGLLLIAKLHTSFGLSQ